MVVPTINEYERESTELLKIAIRKDKLNLVSNNVFLAVIDSDNRPAPLDWKPAVLTDDQKYGYLISGLALGTFTVWARVMSTPEDVIWRVGSIRII